MKLNKGLLTAGMFGISFELLVGLGCATAPQKTSEPVKQNLSAQETSDSRHITNAAALESSAYNFVEVEFKPGSSTLTDNAKTSLSSVVEQARQQGKIDEVLILSWADQEYPSQSRMKLSKEQRALAEKRNGAIEHYVKSLRSVDVDKYNMAEQPTVFEKWFNTSDNKLKNSLISAGLPTTAASVEYPSKAKHAIVLVKIE
jgi:hypothetical protein